MATSRTRKKADQKKKNEAKHRQQQQAHARLRQAAEAFGVPKCNTCGGPRVEVSQNDVPAESWEGLAPAREELKAQGMQVRQIAHCPACNEYSIFGDWQSF